MTSGTRAPDECVARRHALAAPHSREALSLLLHRRDVARHEQPARHLSSAGRSLQQHSADDGVARSRRRRTRRGTRGAGRWSGHGEPRRIVVVAALPAPRVERAIHRFTGRRRVVAANLAESEPHEAICAVDTQPPPGPGVDQRGLTLGVALQQEAGAIAVLRDRSRGAPVPHQRGDDVAARTELRREIDRLVAPVHDVGALRTGRHFLAVDVQPVAIVRRHVDDEPFGARREVERAARVEDHGRVAGHRGRRDPARGGRPGEDAPLCRHRCRRQRQCGACNDRQQIT